MANYIIYNSKSGYVSRLNMFKVFCSIQKFDYSLMKSPK